MNEQPVRYVIAPHVRYGVQSRAVLLGVIFGGLMVLSFAAFTATDKFLLHSLRLPVTLIKSVLLSALLTVGWNRKSVLTIGDNFILGSYSVFVPERIQQDEVTMVQEIPQRFLRTSAGLLVVGKPLSLRRQRAVLVPASVPDYEQIKARLMQWAQGEAVD